MGDSDGNDEAPLLPSPSPSAQDFNLRREGESPLGIRNTPPAFHSLLDIDDDDEVETSHSKSQSHAMSSNGRGRRSFPASREMSPARREDSRHITMDSPSMRPRLPDRKDRTQQSARSISEALRVARAREDQETLLEDGAQADDDGCYPPRKDSIPWQPNPHAKLSVYTTIHRIRRLVIASIGASLSQSIWSTFGD